MTDGNVTAGRIALAASLLVLAPMAGCLQPIGEATQDALVDEEARQAETSGPGNETEAVSSEEIEDSYDAAFKKLDPERKEIRQAQISIHVDPVDPSSEELDAEFYLDIPDEIAVMSFANGTPAEDTAGTQVDTVLVGAVHQTGFVGTDALVMGTYNGSHSWEQAAQNLSNPSARESSSMDPTKNLLEPTRLFTELRDVPDDSVTAWNETTYEGQPAREIHVQHANETEEVDLTIVLDRETDRPLHVEGRLSNASSTGGPADVEMGFHYGDEADHRLADELVRLEAMTIHDANDTELTASLNETKNWTVQPSQNPGTIPLEDVEVQLRGGAGSPGFGEASQLHIALPAEEGQASTPNATLVYEDLDGDGHVSPGDEIRFTPHTRNASSWTLAFEDEKTGMRMAPGAGAALAVAAMAGLAGGLRVRRP